jgi:hypothetical protein
MMQRLIYAAAALLILQLGAALFLQVRSSSGLNAAGPNALFLSFSPDTISSIQISAGDGKKVTLSKKDKSWLMPDAFSAPANSGQVESVLQKLATAKQGLATASTEGAAKRFQTADKDFNRHIVFKEGGKTVADFYLGKSAGLRQSYARVAGQDAVFTIPVSDFDTEATADGWLDKTLARLNREELKQVTLADISLTRKDKDWLLDGAADGEAAKDELDTLLNKITGLSVEAVLDPAEAAPLFQQAPAVQFTVTKNDGSTVTYALAKDKDYYVLKMSASELYFKVGTWQAEELAKMKRESLLVKKTDQEAEETASNPADAETPPAAAPQTEEQSAEQEQQVPPAAATPPPVQQEESNAAE